MLFALRLLYPFAFGALLLATALLWPGIGQREPAPATLTGPLIVHADARADWIASISHEVTLTLENNTALTLHFYNYAARDPAHPAAPALAAFLRGGGSVHGLGRLDRLLTPLLGSPLATLRLDERLTGRLALPAAPAFPSLAEPATDTRLARAAWTWRAAPGERRRPRPLAADSPAPLAPFFAALPRDSLVVPLFRLADAPALHRSTFARLGAVHPAAPPFTATRAALGRDGVLRLVPAVGDTFAQLPLLERFSRLCEVYFTRAAYPFVLAAAAALALLAGAMLLRRPDSKSKS